LAEEAAKLPAKRWAVVAPNYEYGHAVADRFREALRQRRPDVEWVAEQFPTLNKINAGAVVQALKAAQPEALLCGLLQTDLIHFCREGRKRELLTPQLPVFSPILGWPEELDMLKEETPEGWTTPTYPAAEIDLPEHRKFLAAFREKYQEDPGILGLNGYLTIQYLAAAIEKAGTTEVEKVIDALEGLTIASPIGQLTMRAVDHQTDRGLWMGKTTVRDGKGLVIGSTFHPSAPFWPPEAMIRQWRGGN
jgi:branched-chain amino acid transport system substrate-binding protein